MKPPKSPRMRPRINSLYMMLLSFMIGIMLASGLLSGAAYLFLLLFGFLANPFFRLFAMPMLLVVFIMTLSAGIGRAKLRPMNDLMYAMHEVSQGDFSVRGGWRGCAGGNGGTGVQL